ncbi:MAG: UDP-N-acetylmuramoyl-L-alanine--D-glutamate ligase [Clostridia bacterium]|nr:UDP-N-acetylmuramoyl-L-alanine--D-glutamate ligase [Clostridia bacterium]
MRFSDKSDFSVGFFGLGISNIAAMRYIKRHYPRARLILRSDKAPSMAPPDDIKPDEVLFGQDATRGICEDTLFLSPTVRRQRRELTEARDRGTLITSDIEYFLERYRGDAIVISGSDGKSTLTYLCADLLCRAGRSALPCGNFGRSPLDILDTGELAVIELSSFQLTYAKPRATVGCLTSVFSDHLDWHRDIDEYRCAKARVLKGCEYAIADTDEVPSELLPRRLFACVSLEGRYDIGCEHRLGFKEGYITLDGARHLYIGDARRLEEYNIRNYLHLTAVALAMGVGKDALYETVMSFRAIPHRRETVGVFRGIEYINSSIDTSPSRTISTLSGIFGDISLILGGRDKGLDIAPLAEIIKRRQIKCVLIGECREKFAVSLGGCEYEYAEDMQDAIRRATRQLKHGGTVLLSPAATSFGSYCSFEQRGQDFKECVMRLYGEQV